MLQPAHMVVKYHVAHGTYFYFVFFDPHASRTAESTDTVPHEEVVEEG